MEKGPTTFVRTAPSEKHERQSQIERHSLISSASRQLNPNVESWMILAESAALGPRTFIGEDGPVLPKEPDPRAEKGGELLQGMYAQGRRPSFSSRGTSRSCRHCFEGPPDRTKVITTLRRIMTIRRALRTERDGLAHGHAQAWVSV
jgi:hypothetical protein